MKLWKVYILYKESNKYAVFYVYADNMDEASAQVYPIIENMKLQTWFIQLYKEE